MLQQAQHHLIVPFSYSIAPPIELLATTRPLYGEPPALVIFTWFPTIVIWVKTLSDQKRVVVLPCRSILQESSITMLLPELGKNVHFPLIPLGMGTAEGVRLLVPLLETVPALDFVHT
jgi:hypothetical protein